MSLGERILMARKEAGLSQQQLCGMEITRNMLSLIEHDSACPSLATLRYLASRLGKPISYFMEEESTPSPEQQMITTLREVFDAQSWTQVLERSQIFSENAVIFEREIMLIKAISVLSLAEEAIEGGRMEYARDLLDSELTATYFNQEIIRRKVLLLGQLPEKDPVKLCDYLPCIDQELILRARAALASENFQRAGQLLDAVEDKKNPRWNLLRGECHMMEKKWSDAIPCFQNAVESFPQKAYSSLEICYRELQDFQNAYYCACQLREKT